MSERQAASEREPVSAHRTTSHQHPLFLYYVTHNIFLVATFQLWRTRVTVVASPPDWHTTCTIVLIIFALILTVAGNNCD